ncbi:MAG TPA: DNA repair protein RadC [Candidatus Saccharimonadales bacterium]|nr:DNA repair protein RadC [Candidatus Saccharimonadales bacterium]
MSYKINDRNTILNYGRLYKIARVKDMPDEEKPREKMLENGPGALSAAELLAIILGTGTKKEEVFSMSSRLLREYGEKGIAYQKNPTIIEKDLGIPLTKACQIVACFELGRRFYQKKPGGSITIRTAKQAHEYLKDMGNLNKEQFRGLYLNTHYQLIHDEVISIGTLDAAIVQPREVFRPALEYSAAAMIIAHNHPSGVLKATKADVEITDKLINAGKILDIEVLDHLIIGKNRFISII